MDPRDAERPSPPPVPGGPTSPASADGDPTVPATQDPAASTQRDAVTAALEGLPITGFTKRRVAFVLAALVSAWIVLVFARQVGDASTATARAAEMGVANTALADRVAALQRELQTIQTDPYVLQQARAYQLGSRGEIPFELAPDAPPLPADAPGSAAARLGEPPAAHSPLESWLTMLFGSSPAD